MKCAYSENGNSKCQFEHIKNVLHLSVPADGEWFCPFHAPMKVKDGYPTAKGDWPDIYRKWIYEKILELREDALAKQEKLDLSGVVFPGDADFQDVEFPEVDFSHARFEGNADFQNARFSGGNAHFSSAKFCGETHFSGATFSGGDVDFKNAEFSEIAQFSHVKFNGGNIDFLGTKFSQFALFNKTEFNEGASFQDSQFIMDATFRETKFTKGKVIFQGAEFLGVDFSLTQFTNKNTDFQETRFNGRADFTDTYFERNVIFQNAQFLGGEAIFRNAKFDENANFSRTKFIGGNAWFNNAEFRGENTVFANAEFNDGRAAHFSAVKFISSANFKNTKFSDWGAHFSDSEFRGVYTNFQSVRFDGDASFLNVQFISEIIEFQDSSIKGRADFTSPRNNRDMGAFHGWVNFEGVTFLGHALFENREFQQATNLRQCTFHKAPRFHGCQLHEDTDFTDAKFLDTASPGSAMAYRTLKLDMEEKRARQEQLMFYALEMKSRRSEEKRKFLKLISWLYEATSDYGQRIFLPLAWLAFFFWCFTFFYASYFKELLDLDAANVLSQSLHFSIKQIVRPFGVFGFSSTFGLLGTIAPSSLLSLPLIIAATLQSFLSLALLLLSALAARWRFKIG